ncbi:MAG: M48 family metalloprotease [Planctomycetes bacterium]|nr:M48 family metalloprotease [Planctomycetota bacterium]
MSHVLLLMAGLWIYGMYPIGSEPLAFLPSRTAGPWPTVLVTLLFTGLYPVVGWGMIHFLWWGFTRRGWPVERFHAVLQRSLIAWRALLAVLYAIEIYLLHWPILVGRVWGLEGIPVLKDLAGLAPFLTALALSWIPTWGLDRRMRGSVRWPLRDYLAFQARGSLGLFLVPVLIFLGASDVLGHIPWARYALAVYPALATALFPLGMLAMYAASPFLLGMVLSTSTLPAGALRARLAALAVRADFRYRDIRIWHTQGGQLSNALVVGLWGRLRYVLLTDALLEQLTPEEIEGVFGHEMGHARHHHLPVFFLFLIGGMFLYGALAGLAASIWPELGQEAAQVLLLGAWFGGGAWLFGHLSRRFERQADLFGARVVGEPGRFARALLKVADQNGIPRGVGSWRYYSIDRRVHEVYVASVDPRTEAGFRRELSRVLACVGVIVTLGVAAAVYDAVLSADQTAENRRRYAAIETASAGERRLEAEDYAGAERELHESWRDLKGTNFENLVLFLQAEAIWAQGRRAEAEPLYRAAEELHPHDPEVRHDLLARLAELGAGAGGD